MHRRPRSTSDAHHWSTIVRRRALTVGAVLLAGAGLNIAMTRPGARTRGADHSLSREITTAFPHADAPPDTTLWIELRGVDLHIDDTHALRIRDLRGQVMSASAAVIPFLDQPSSFSIRVTSGTVGMTGPDLAALLNSYVFAYPQAPLHGLSARVDGGQLVLSGTMHKGVDLPFEITSTLSLQPNGLIRAHSTRVRLLGVNGEALLHALGFHLNQVLDLKGSHGASVDGDDLLLDPDQMVPPPMVVGKLASIAIQGDQVVQTFVRLAADTMFNSFAVVDTMWHGFVNFRGGRLRFGKLTMTDTDLLIVGADQQHAFDLDLAHYNQQLVAGTTANLPNLGLRVTMPNYASLKRAASGKP
jgi:hypothetical protein